MRPFNGQLGRQELPKTVPVIPENPHKHRMSRRSISKHPQEPGTLLNLLKLLVSPEVEVVDEPVVEMVDIGELDKLDKDAEVTLEECLPKIQINFVRNDVGEDGEKAYIEKIDTLVTFHETLEESRANIRPLKEYLDEFEQNLSKLSREMEFLQKKSDSLNDEIADKKKIESQLTPIINDLIIPPEVIKSILSDEINEKWCENLRFIAEKQEIYLKYLNQDLKFKSILDLQKILAQLIVKCVERIRDFIIRKIKMLRVNGVPSQVVQRQLLSVGEIYPFLLTHHRSLALELRQLYIYTMRWYYHSFFAKYLYSLENLKIHQVGKHVLLNNTNEDSLQQMSNASSSFSFFSQQANSSRPQQQLQQQQLQQGPDRAVLINEYLNLGDRGSIITADDPTVILAQIAENNQLTYWMEFGFRNFNLALLDNVSVEYLFINEFFCIKNDTKENINQICDTIFQRTFNLGINYTKSLINDTYDSYGVLICIRLSQAFEYELQHRRIPVMEDYLNLQMISLWPRFQKIVDANCENMKKALSKLSLISSTSTFFGSGSSTKNENPLIPTLLTQQFAKYLCGLLKLTTHSVFETEQVEPLSTSIQRLTNDFENILNKLNNMLNKNNNDKKELFLYNNYYLVYTTLTSLDSKLAVQEREHFKMLIDAYEPK